VPRVIGMLVSYSYPPRVFIALMQRSPQRILLVLFVLASLFLMLLLHKCVPLSLLYFVTVSFHEVGVLRGDQMLIPCLELYGLCKGAGSVSTPSRGRAATVLSDCGSASGCMGEPPRVGRQVDGVLRSGTRGAAKLSGRALSERLQSGVAATAA